MQRYKRPLFTIVAILLGLVLLEAILQLVWLAPGLSAARQPASRAVEFKEDFHARHDPDLGWAHQPGKQIVDFYGPGRTIKINRQGLRGDEVYSPQVPPDRFRVICLGDSFTLGYGVDDAATYPAQLEAVNPAVQAVNMGQGGYSIGQCYLWYQRDGGRLQAHALVAAFVLDDIWRMTDGRMANGAAMPQFELTGGRLRVSGRPVPEKIAAGEIVNSSGQILDFLFDRSAIFRTASLATSPLRAARDNIDRTAQLRVALSILAELHREAALRRTPMLLVILPELDELTDPTRQSFFRDVVRIIAASARQADIPLLDLSTDFLAAGDVEGLYLDEHWHHFSEAGNRLFAERLDAYLGEKLPNYPPRP